MLARTLLLTTLAATLASCVDPSSTPPGQAPAGGGKGDVWGTDDRKELSEYRGTPWFDAARTEGGIIDTPDLLLQDDGTYALPAAKTLHDANNLCTGQRFEAQPTTPYCSGTLIAPDLVVTAGHCLRSCYNISFVFGIGYEDALPTDLFDVVSHIPADNVYRCTELVAREQTEHIGPSGTEAIDYALLRLDRPVVGRTPATINISRKLTAGTKVAVIGHPSGLPLKIAPGNVLDPAMQFMVPHDADVFGGNSGCGLFDEHGVLVGMHSRSSSQRYVEQNGCYVVAECGVNASCPDVPRAYDTVDLWSKLPDAIKAELTPQ